MNRQAEATVAAMTKPVRVLLADDDPIVRQAVRAILEAAGGFAIVAEAEDGQVAADLVQKHSPDVLLLDLLMPRLPGLEALRALATATTGVRILLLCSTITNKQCWRPYNSEREAWCLRAK